MSFRTAAVLLAVAGVAFAVPNGKSVNFDRQGVGRVTFQGTTHAGAGLKCNACHPHLFKMKRGSSSITMRGMASGEFCGSCHNGGRAFSVSDRASCERCHRSGAPRGYEGELPAVRPAPVPEPVQRPVVKEERPAPPPEPTGEDDFKNASTANTLGAYEAFLAKYPKSSLRPKALAAMADLIRKGGDAASEFRFFLRKYPDGAEHVPIDYCLDAIGPSGLTVMDIINQKKKGMGDRILVSKIRSSGGTYKDFSFDEILVLKKKGLSDAIIEAMIESTTEAKNKAGK